MLVASEDVLFYSTPSKLERLARQMEIPMDELRWFLRELVEQRQSEESHEQNRELEEPEHANR